jgi:hypothetical protein
MDDVFDSGDIITLSPRSASASSTRRHHAHLARAAPQDTRGPAREIDGRLRGELLAALSDDPVE